MAAPHVAAAFAILKQADSGATVAEMESALKGNGLMVYDPKIGLNFPRIRISMALDEFMPPTAPDTITATTNSSSKITVVWENVTGETGYTLQYHPSTSGTWVSLPSTILTFRSHTGLICGTKYYYRVFSSNANGNSGYSPTASATTEACPAPTGLVATTGRLFGTPVVVVEWNDIAGDAGYKLQRYTGIPIIVAPKQKGNQKAPIIGIGGWKTVFEADTDATVGVEAVPCQVNYTYRVIAIGNDVNSAPSASVSINTTDCIDEENLLVNGGFEVNADGDPILPDGWTKGGPMKQDSVISDPAQSRTGSNAFRFVGKPQDKSSIKQVIDLTGKTFAQNDKLRFSGYLKRQSAPEGLLVMRLIVVYMDKTKQKLDLKLKTGTVPDGYNLYASSLTMQQGAVKKMTVTLQYKTTSGKLLFDNVALVQEVPPAPLQLTADELLSLIASGALEQPGTITDQEQANVNGSAMTRDGNGTQSLIPVPAAPADLRGN
jgi:fibronectin type 3 domain-containing protein